MRILHPICDMIPKLSPLDSTELLDDPVLPHLASIAGGDGVVFAPGEVPAHGALGQAQVQHGVGVVGEHGRGHVNCRVRTVLS